HSSDPSSPNGTFQIAGVAPGAYSLRVIHRDYSTYTSDLEIGPKDRNDLEISLEVGATVFGNVLGLSPEEFSNWQVTMISKFGRRRGLLDDDGRFRIEHLSPGTWDLYLSKDRKSYVDQKVFIETSEDSIEINLVP
ncbi:MAG: carboxypeptidase regulatory-like domain-containing protein, partial [Acidobacteriota bacterium]